MAELAASPRRKSQYRGVSWESRKRKWKARIKIGERTQHFLYAEDELDCAWTADFVRFMLFGLDYHKWPTGSLKPNFAPCRFERVHRPSLVREILMRGLIHPNELVKRLVEYDRLAEFLRPTNTDSETTDDTASTPTESTPTDDTVATPTDATPTASNSTEETLSASTPTDDTPITPDESAANDWTI